VKLTPSLVTAFVLASTRFANAGVSPGLIDAINNAGIYQNYYCTTEKCGFPVYVCRNFATDLCDALFPTYMCFADLQWTAGHAQVIVNDPDPNSVFVHYCLVEPQWSGDANAGAQCWYQESGPPTVPPWVSPTTTHLTVPSTCLSIANFELSVAAGAVVIGEGIADAVGCATCTPDPQ